MKPAVRLFAGWSPAVLVLIALLLLLIVPPFYFLLKTSLYTTNADGSFGDFTLEYYRELFSSPRFFGHFLNSALFAGGSAVLAIVLGAAQAWIVERTDTPLRQYVFLIAVVSLEHSARPLHGRVAAHPRQGRAGQPVAHEPARVATCRCSRSTACGG